MTSWRAAGQPGRGTHRRPHQRLGRRRPRPPDWWSSTATTPTGQATWSCASSPARDGGHPGAQVIKELGPAGTDVVVPKRYYSAFTQTDLEATCLVHDVRRIVVVGQHTDCCVPHTS